MPRTDEETNAINRVLKARGLPPLDHPHVLGFFGTLIQDHTHFTELLKACEPALRREMYEALRPHLHFPARSLEDYMIAAKQYAEARELPTIAPDGSLKPYTLPVIEVERQEYELWAQCSICGRESFVWAESETAAVTALIAADWDYDASSKLATCPVCLGEKDHAMDPPAGAPAPQ